jgi:predicted Ser/Thr protein kinase
MATVMKIHCPHCLEETELENSVADSVVRCVSCKAVFDPRKKDTVPQAVGADARAELLPGICAGDGFGGYVLERKLGKGGMGIVFAATQLSLGRKVAIKVLAHDLLDDPEFVKRFEREARALASLNHPNIVKVIDKGIERGNVYLVMEYVDGVSLRDLMNDRRLPARDALKLIPQLCDALEYAHSRGVIHRDVKPENILIDTAGGLKVADFGLARIVGEPAAGRITRSNAVMGSLDYMAPEQRERTKEADHRADIYALGVVVYEMLTGELPLGRFEPPSKKVKLDVDIDEVVLRVLSKDPELRYQRASEVGEEIRRRSAGAREAASAGAATGAALPEDRDLARAKEPGPRTAGGRAIRKLCDEVGSSDLNRRVVSVALLVCFAWLLLILAAVETVVENHREEERKRLERLALKRREEELRRREREARASLPASPWAQRGAQAGLALALTAGLALAAIGAMSRVLPHARREVELLAGLAGILLGAGVAGGVLASVAGLGQAIFSRTRGAGLALVGIGLGFLAFIEVLGLFRFAGGIS